MRALRVVLVVAALGCSRESEPGPAPVGRAPPRASEAARDAGVALPGAPKQGAPAPPRISSGVVAARPDAGPPISPISCNLPDTLEDSIHFEPGSAELSADAKARLDRVAACITNGPFRGARLALVGFTDPVEPAGNDDELARARAEAVRAYLVARGVPPTSLETVARHRANAAGLDSSWRALERRVEVDILEPPPR